MTIPNLQQSVFAACDRLLANGEKITVRSILTLVPEAKSTSTIHKPFAAWKEQREANEQQLYEKLGFSPEFTKAFLGEISRFATEAESRHVEAKLLAKQQLEDAIQELEITDERYNKQQAVVEQQSNRIKELEIEIANAQKNFESQLEQQAKAHEATVIELRQQLGTSKDETRAMSEIADGLRTELAKSQLRLEGNISFTDEVRGQNEALNRELKDLHQQIADFNKSQAAAEAMIAGNEKLITQTASALDETKKALSVLSKEKLTLVSEIDDAQAELRANAAEITQLKQVVAGLQSTVVNQERYIKRIEGDNGNS
jgi:chromosome segregation ATPase